MSSCVNLKTCARHCTKRQGADRSEGQAAGNRFGVWKRYVHSLPYSSENFCHRKPTHQLTKLNTLLHSALRSYLQSRFGEEAHGTEPDREEPAARKYPFKKIGD